MMVKLLQNKKTKKQKFTTKRNYGKTKDVVPNIKVSLSQNFTIFFSCRSKVLLPYLSKAYLAD